MKLSEETLANEKTDTVSFSGVGSSSQCFFLGRREKKSGRESPFLGSFSIFPRAKIYFHARVFRFFSRPYFFFSRPKFGFFSRAKNKFHGQKYDIFHGQYFFFTDIFWANQPTCLSLSQAFFFKKKITNRGFCKTGPYNMHGAGGVVQWWDTKGARSILLRGKNGLAAAAKKSRAAYWAPLSQLPLFR